MVILDVLLIGSGPQALTLASLLTNQEPGDSNLGHDSSPSPSPSPSCLDPLRTETNSSNRRRCSAKKKKKKKKTTTVSAGATVEEKPATPEKVVLPPLSLRVVDSYGEWAALWESQFAALNIPHLRSHTLVHTDPLNKMALQDFVLRCDRSAELHSLPDQLYILDENAFFNDMRLGKKEKKRLNVTSTLKKSLSFSLPGTRLSVDFFRDQVQRYDLDKLLIKGTVEKIVPVTEHREEEEGRGEENDSVKEWETEGETESRGDRAKKEKKKKKKKRVKYFQVHLQQESIVLKARRVVVATGPTRAQMANVPSWVRSIGESFPEERLQHTVQLMHHLTKCRQEVRDAETSPDPELCVVCEPGQRVMVVGGGLTSAHVVSIALQQGASHVTWVMRKHLQLKQFDVGDVESLVGRYSHVEHGIKMDGRAYLRQFYNERSLHKRLAMIRQARKGGAVTPEAYVHLQPFILSGQVDVRTYCQVSEARWCYRSQAWSLTLSTGGLWTGDRIWLATGCKLDVTQDPLLSQVMEEFPVQVLDGWPCLSESLQWTDGCPLYLMGQYTALQVGPHAVNLAGGQAASMRIYKDIVHHVHQDRDGDGDGGAASDLSGDKPRTEQYVEEMRGLLWL